MPSISVIVPIYNVEPYLASCLDSILSQSFSDLEVILINDGSEDSCGEICEKYALADNRVKVVHQKNAGVSSARNKGIDISNGDYLAFVDPDDTIESNMYEVMFLKAKENNADMIVCPIKTINSFNKTETISSIWTKAEGLYSKADIEENIIISSIVEQKTYSLVSSVNKLYKKSLFSHYEIKFDEDKSHSEDMILNFKILPLLNSLVFIPQPLYNYFVRREDSLTQTFREDFYDYIVVNRELFLNRCCEYKLFNAQEKIRYKYAGITLSYLEDIMSCSLPNYKKLKMISKIVNDNEFINDIRYYHCPSIFTKLLKAICKLRNEKLVYSLIVLKVKIKTVTKLRDAIFS
ncbi:glycosyltransferase family 2 protein [Halobacillus sp. A5]|uniref:glycosyltransferase family 2 protein n=1 Tax=Halobacillus sp. A5 TaxID=2880263 RepID=UPI0020A673BE|nr:glycosyltransferase [Halobacillus sp. A5]MCP3029185.1 glycosyltransferase [Halobacillus sp. A5]